MEINIPSIEAQKRFIFEQATKEAIRQLEQNLTAPVIEDLGMDESQYNNEHLLPENRWKPPHQDIVYAYIEQFKRHSEYKSDKAVAAWLGMRGNNAERNWLTLPIPRNCKISQNDRASALLESLAYCVVRSRSL